METKSRWIYLPFWQFTIAVIVYILALDQVPGIPPFWARKLTHMGCGALMMVVDTRKLSGRLVIAAIAVISLLRTWLPVSAEDVHLYDENSWRLYIKPFRYGQTYDIGITFYLIIMMEWALLKMPMSALAPVFFSDPLAAIVGKHFHPRIPIYPGHHKTVFGSIAVFISVFISIGFCYMEFDRYRKVGKYGEEHKRIKQAEGFNAQKATSSVNNSNGNAGTSNNGNEKDNGTKISFKYRFCLSVVCTFTEALGGKVDNLLLAVPVIIGWTCFHFLGWGCVTKEQKKRLNISINFNSI